MRRTSASPPKGGDWRTGALAQGPLGAAVAPVCASLVFRLAQRGHRFRSKSRAPAAHHRTDGVHRGHHLIVRNRKPNGGKGDFAGRADKTSRPPPPRPEPGQTPGVPAWATGRQDHTMPRAYWKGYLRLSLVTCPIELFPATSQAEALQGTPFPCGWS
jgi:hypothetical protein